MGKECGYTEGIKGHMAPLTNHIFLGGFRSEKVYPVHFQYGHVDVDVNDDKDEDRDEERMRIRMNMMRIMTMTVTMMMAMTIVM